MKGFQTSPVIDPQLLIITCLYLEASKGHLSPGIFPDLDDALKTESFESETLKRIKSELLRFAMVTDNVGHFGSAVCALAEFNDPSLHHHFTVWLDAHLRKLKSHAGAVDSLLRALERTGAKNMKHRQGGGICDVEDNIEAAQIYLGETLGQVYPWGA